MSTSRTSLLAWLAPLLVPANALAQEVLDELVVTSKRQPVAMLEHIGNVSTLDRDAIEAQRHAHIHELLTRIPGVWVVRASGQESLPSIRSPVLTGPGSCGAFLILEDGVPTRPGGFCNVNQLFELPTELASSIEVIRGPGSALYGSSALHGTVNVLLPRVSAGDFAALELGSNQFLRFSGQAGSAAPNGYAAGLVYASDGGFRADSGYEQAKIHFSKSTDVAGGNLDVSLSMSDLDQETAGFILGEDAYEDPVLYRQNLNPEAFRKASSQRLTAHWQSAGPSFDIDIRPYVRYTDMEFLQHFLPGRPLEENGHTSAGVLTALSFATQTRKTVAGLDAEWADVFLRQTQHEPTEGSAFLQETRPEGRHYDYDVRSLGAALFVESEFRVSDQLSMSVGLRSEFVHYDYSNRMLDGNTRDDGTPCGFGGCLYTRPESRSDNFFDLAPKAGLLFRIDDSTSIFAIAGRGFRSPQMTELYRLQSGQEVSDLDSETIDSFELGFRSFAAGWRLDAAAYLMRKKNSVYRDANGYNVGDGRSRHRGVEITWDLDLGDNWQISIDGTYALHQYDFDAVAARGETFVSGFDIDTAPRWQGSAELRFMPAGRLDASLQWVALGPYFLDAENQHTYPGHDVLNLRARVKLTDTFSLSARINNVTDRRLADRADFAFGNYRYFPGRGREFILELRVGQR